MNLRDYQVDIVYQSGSETLFVTASSELDAISKTVSLIKRNQKRTCNYKTVTSMSVKIPDKVVVEKR